MSEYDVAHFAPTLIAFVTACREPGAPEAMAIWQSLSDEGRIALAAGLAGMVDATAGLLSELTGESDLLQAFAAAVQLMEEGT